MAEGARLESVYTATYRGFESPPHRHILRRARTKVRAFFSHVAPTGGGREPPTGVRQLATPVGQTASPRAGCPAGASEASQSPPHRHIRDESLYASTGFFFACGTHRGDENPRPGFDNWRSQLDRPRARERAAPQGRAKRVNPPLTAIFEMRACTQVRALFFYILRRGEPPEKSQSRS